MLSVEENFFAGDEIFGRDQHLAIAVGFFDAEYKDMDEEKGELVFYVNEWGYNDKGKFFNSYEKIPSHICTDAELGLTSDPSASSFFKMSESVHKVVRRRQKSLHCIDSD